jgi:hypothetical protein
MPTLLVLAISLALMLSTRDSCGSVRAFNDEATPEPPLAVRVYRVFQLPGGSHRWLPSLAKLIAGIPRTDRWTPRVRLTAREAFQRSIAEARVLVKALNNGANPVALHDKLLGALNLSLGYTVPKGKKWKYGSLQQRTELVYLLTRNGVSLALHGHKNRGRRWLIAALLLSCQDDIERPWEATLNSWVRVPLVQGSASWNAEMRTSHAAFLALFSSPAQQRQLDKLFRLATQLDGGKFARNYNALFRARIAKTPGGRSAAVGAMVLHLRAAISEVPSLYWRFALLREVLLLRRGLNLRGDRLMSDAVKAILNTWRGKIKADPNISRFEREALLRWIKEASI